MLNVFWKMNDCLMQPYSTYQLRYTKAQLPSREAAVEAVALETQKRSCVTREERRLTQPHDVPTLNQPQNVRLSSSSSSSSRSGSLITQLGEFAPVRGHWPGRARTATEALELQSVRRTGGEHSSQKRHARTRGTPERCSPSLAVTCTSART
uniref:Uncharacterized protein n=1 Tax=Mesocestoides corti TaxID=53468 RepID=A0A5K3FSF9_MESCO